MTFFFKGQTISEDETRLACAFVQHIKMSEDILGSIIGFRRGGPGAPPVLCEGLVDELQHSQHASVAIVASNLTYWESKAREEYRRWWDIHSQIVQRLKAEGEIVPYLDTERERTA